MKAAQKIAHAAFLDGAIGLLRRALADGLGARVTVGGGDATAELLDGGVVLTSTRLGGAQLALPLAAPPAPKACTHTWERVGGQGVPYWYACVWCDRTVARGHADFEEIDARHRRNVELEAPASPVEPCACDDAPWSVEIGDTLTLDGKAVEVMGVDAEAFVWRTVTDDPFEREEGETEWASVERIDDAGRVTLKAVEPKTVVTTVDPSAVVDGRDFSAVPEHFRDLAPLAEPDWWCVIAQDSTRPEETRVSRCTDLDTATSVAARAHTDWGDELDRLVAFTPEGRVCDALTWTRYAPTSEALTKHPEAKLFRVSTRFPDAFANAQAWADEMGLGWYASTYQRISPAEIDERNFWLLWFCQNSEAVVVVPRELLLFVERRAAELVSDEPRATLRIEPWTATDNHHALRVGSLVSVGDVDWRVFLLSSSVVTLTRDPDEVADCDLEDLAPTGCDSRWWLAGKLRKPKPAKTPKPAKAPKTKKAPKLHRQTKLADADALAPRGTHRVVALYGEEWRTLAIRESAETAPEWERRCAAYASAGVRVRVYDGGARCTWDSLDGTESEEAPEPVESEEQPAAPKPPKKSRAKKEGAR